MILQELVFAFYCVGWGRNACRLVSVSRKAGFEKESVHCRSVFLRRNRSQMQMVGTCSITLVQRACRGLGVWPNVDDLLQAKHCVFHIRQRAFVSLILINVRICIQFYIVSPVL